MLLLTIVICAVPVSWLIVKQPTRQISLIESRYLNTFPKLEYQSFRTSIKRVLQGNNHEASSLFWGQFLDRSFQKNFGKASSDQFPFRMKFINFSRAIDRILIKLAYTPFSDPAIPAAMNSINLIMRDGSRLISRPALFNKKTKNLIDEHIRNLQALIDQYPDKTFSYFYLERIASSRFHPLNQYFSDSDRGQMYEYFNNNKPADLQLGALLFSSIDDLLENFYKTDHHWNIHGIRKAYYEIYSLLSANNPDISEKLNLQDIYAIPDIQFLGSYARQTMYPIQGEKFEIAKINLSPYKIITNEEVIENTQGDPYSRKSYPKEDYTNYYGIFLAKDKNPLEYVFENGSDRNLLIFGNSFTRPLVPLLAYHYHHTYYIDLISDKSFSFAEFVATHPVDDVLIISDFVMLYRDEWIIDP